MKLSLYPKKYGETHGAQKRFFFLSGVSRKISEKKHVPCVKKKNLSKCDTCHKRKNNKICEMSLRKRLSISESDFQFTHKNVSN